MLIDPKMSDDNKINNDPDLFGDDIDNFREMMNNVFQERFEIDLNSEEYEKIDVPDFRDGRSGRFIHDFNFNKTCIIDLSGNRCFVMPLNRENVLPPRSLFDLIQKMWEGYYKVDTKVVRESMKVVIPPISDREEVGSYIGRECADKPIYKLEKDESKSKFFLLTFLK